MPDPQAPLPPPPWRCGEFVIDPDARLVTRDGAPMAIGARAFDLLLALANAQGRLTSADALRAAVWPRARVAENNLRVQLTHLRKLLGAGAIEYRPNQGYRLTSVLRPAAAAAEAPIAHAPEPTVEVLGRGKLLGGIAEALQGRDRITLHGPAGAGKTLLAQAAAHRAAAGFADGAWWVDLAPLSEAALLADAVAQALQLPPGPEAASRLASHLAGRQLLLVLDNCEHLRDATSTLCDGLLRAAPRVTVLCTSRVALKCAGEHLVPVGALDLPAPGATLEQARASGALAVFEDRVRRLDARFKLVPGNLDAATDICRRLDGMAFAITVAAARVPALGLAEVRARLDERLQWRARLGDEQADHQAALQDTLDWSHALLGAAAQRVLVALGVFAGSFALDDLRALLPALALDDAALPRALHDLVEHGFLQIDTPALLEAASPRYGMHESVRLYARGRLAADTAADGLHAAHARHFMALMAGPHAAKGGLVDEQHRRLGAHGGAREPGRTGRECRQPPGGAAPPRPMRPARTPRARRLPPGQRAGPDGHALRRGATGRCGRLAARGAGHCIPPGLHTGAGVRLHRPFAPAAGARRARRCAGHAACGDAAALAGRYAGHVGRVAV